MLFEIVYGKIHLQNSMKSSVFKPMSHFISMHLIKNQYWFEMGQSVLARNNIANVFNIARIA